MGDSRHPPGYIPLTIHSLGGSGQPGQNTNDRSGGGQRSGRGGSKPRGGGRPSGKSSPGNRSPKKRTPRRKPDSKSSEE